VKQLSPVSADEQAMVEALPMVRRVPVPRPPASQKSRVVAPTLPPPGELTLPVCLSVWFTATCCHGGVYCPLLYQTYCAGNYNTGCRQLLEILEISKGIA